MGDYCRIAFDAAKDAKNIADLRHCLKGFFKSMKDSEALKDQKIASLERQIEVLMEEKAEYERIIENNADSIKVNVDAIKEVKSSIAAVETTSDLTPDSCIVELQNSLDNTD